MSHTTDTMYTCGAQPVSATETGESLPARPGTHHCQLRVREPHPHSAPAAAQRALAQAEEKLAERQRRRRVRRKHRREADGVLAYLPAQRPAPLSVPRQPALGARQGSSLARRTSQCCRLLWSSQLSRQCECTYLMLRAWRKACQCKSFKVPAKVPCRELESRRRNACVESS